MQRVLDLTRRVHWVFYGFLALGVHVLGRVRVLGLVRVVVRGLALAVLGLAIGLGLGELALVVHGLGLALVVRGPGLALVTRGRTTGSPYLWLGRVRVVVLGPLTVEGGGDVDLRAHEN